MKNIRIQLIDTIVSPSVKTFTPENIDARIAALMYVAIMKKWSGKTSPLYMLANNFETIAVNIPHFKLPKETVMSIVINVLSSRSVGRPLLSWNLERYAFTIIDIIRKIMSFKFTNSEIRNRNKTMKIILDTNEELRWNDLTFEYLDLVFLMSTIIVKKNFV